MKKYTVTMLLFLAAFILLPKFVAAQTIDAYITRQVNSKIAKSVIESNHPKGKRNTAKGKSNNTKNRSVKAKTIEKPHIRLAEMKFEEDWHHRIGGDASPLFTATFKFVPLDASKKPFTRTHKFTPLYEGLVKGVEFTDIPGGSYTVTGELILEGKTTAHQIYFATEIGNQLYPNKDNRVFKPSFELNVELGKDNYGDAAMIPNIGRLWMRIKSSNTSTETSKTKASDLTTNKDKIGMTDEQFLAIGQLGIKFYNEDKLDKAQTIFEGMLQLEPQNADVNASLGGVLEKKGQDKEALKYLNKALELNDQHPAALYNRAEIYLRQNKNKEAAADLEKAIEIIKGENPSFTKAAQKLLKEISKKQQKKI